MSKFQIYQQRIIDEINKLNFDINPVELYEPISYSLSTGGKRIRPVLVLLACDLFSGDIEKAVSPALAYEIFHNFTLIHDDIMDNSDIRRNNATVHKKWNDNIAILSGDAMMIKSYEYFFDLEPELFKKVMVLFNKTALEVCEGQQYDMNFETKNNIGINEYIKMIKLKTSVLIAACLKTGAIIAGSSNKNAGLIYDFGINIGLAFQLQDDLLDVYGNIDVFGKETGKDIVANKKTFLLINALQKADKQTKKTIEEWLNKKIFDKTTKIKAITEIYDSLHIGDIVREHINAYFDKAHQSLKQIDVAEEKKQDLLQFAGKLQNRLF